MANCVFCEIAAKRLDAELTVFEDDDVLVQVSLQQKPGNHGHVVVMPKAHVETIFDLRQEHQAPLMAALQWAAQAVKSAFSADGIQIRQNNGRAAGQDVFHLHFHVIPRYERDAFDARPYERLPRDVRLAIAGALRDAMG